ncbi:MAG TPA: amidohydrolase family protein, partial [Pyrinomonadaceae bacterium]|nr:amidohydrolase family protein [Pyrinomonadaceae bacterium]
TRVGGAGAEDGVLVPAAMVAATIGNAALGEGARAPGTRSKMVAMLRAELLRAQDYAAKQALAEDKRPARDLHLEAWARVIKREIPLLVTAHRAVDIASALRLAREFNFRLVLDGASEAYLLIDQIKAANVPVIVHPTMFRNTGEAENLSMETAARLRRAGVTVALQSSYESYVPKTRVVLFEAALAAANGLSFEEALATVTIDAARILGVEARVGSLAAGKDADLALYDGDPFEYTSHAVGVVIDGQVVSESVR